MRLPRVAGFRARLRAQGAAEHQIVPRWGVPLLALCTIGLIPWSILLLANLPDQKTARHWDLAWGGFDIVLAVSLATTVVLVVRRTPLAEMAATACGTMLCVDAWFDVLTAADGDERLLAVGMALLIELPLAWLCFRIAHNIEQVMDRARRYAIAAGYRGGAETPVEQR